MRSFGVVFVLVGCLVLSVAFSVEFFSLGLANPSSMIPPPPPLPRVFIRADGSVDPASSPVLRVGNVYTLTASVAERVIDVQCDNVVVDGAGNAVTGKTYENGVVLSNRKNVTVKDFVLRTFSGGIYLWNSTGCTVEGSTVTNSSRGIIVTGQSKNNIVRGNLLRDNVGGIYVSYSGNNQFRNNVMQNNKYNFQMELGNAATPRVSLSDLINDVDFSNTVNGKPVCYWINQVNKVVPSDCGCVVLVGCKGIAVENLGLSDNGCGVLLFATTDTTISNNVVAGNGYGVWADSTSARISIEQNEISTNSDDGISLVGSGQNRVVSNTIIENDKLGIRLEDSEDSRVIGNTIRKNYYGGIGLANVSRTTLAENLITDHHDNSRSAIALGLTSDSDISGNTLENNGVGLEIHDLSKNNTITANIMRNNQNGIHFYYTTMYGPYSYPVSSNTLRNNRFDGNEAPLRFESSFTQDIDASNTVNGKPVCYWVNQHDKSVPLNVGYIALINCDKITVENVDISNNKDGILLFGTTNTLVTKSRFSDNNENGIYVRHSNNNIFSENQVFSNRWNGVFVEDSSNNVFVQNLVANNLRNGIELLADNCNIIKNNVTSNGDAGIKLNGAKNNTIQDNYVARNEPGILLIWGTSHCRVIGNTLTENNKWGMRIEGSETDSVIHHNNFINNKVNQSLQISIPWPADPNVWDDGAEGNYWSDYKSRYPNASEIGNRGVGDTEFFINENNIDHFPLMEPIGLADVSSPLQPSASSPDDNSTVPAQQDENDVGTNVSNEQILTLAATGTVVAAVALAFTFRRRTLTLKR